MGEGLNDDQKYMDWKAPDVSHKKEGVANGESAGKRELEPDAKDRIGRSMVADIPKHPEDKDGNYAGYAGMMKDPVHNGKHFLRFDKGSVDGYDTAILDDNGEIVTIGIGEKIPVGVGRDNTPVHEYDLGQEVIVQGDYNALGGLKSGETAKIIKFHEPFKNGGTDHIIVVQQGEKIVTLKPSEIRKV